ncbi:MAG: ATP-binding cassette domain-containing protein [Butyricicoccus sp.]|nr:ATP-binding cassette domain-containing protein [Butyricicoccus sp.]
MIEIKSLTAAYGENTVLENCSLTVPDGTRAALMGASGCGKTTLLRAVAGLLRPISGSADAGGHVSFVFQEPRLFPWLTSEQNVSAVLPGHGDETRDTSRELLRRAGLSGAEGKYPGELSGGMQQRVSLCRALAYGGDALLLDEPFRGLDDGLRRDVAALILEHSRGTAILLSTHDAREAELLGATVYEYRDRRFVLREI